MNHNASQTCSNCFNWVEKSASPDQPPGTGYCCALPPLRSDIGKSSFPTTPRGAWCAHWTEAIAQPKPIDEPLPLGVGEPAPGEFREPPIDSPGVACAGESETTPSVEGKPAEVIHRRRDRSHH